MPSYIVGPGESIPSIAKDNGFLWKTIWEHEQNRALKQLRKDPNVLLEGDEVYLPDPTTKTETRPTKAKHTFVRLGEPTKIKIQMKKMGKPRANEQYTIEIDGVSITGVTDGSGNVEQFMPGNSRRAVLKLKDGKEEYRLKIGHLDPVEETSGVQQRLSNLGFDCGDEDGYLGPVTKAAIAKFQKQQGLMVTGEPNALTCNKLKELHK
jgi:hypothetical protein